MRFYFPVDLTGNLVMIEKLVLGEIWTGDLPIFVNANRFSESNRKGLNKFFSDFMMILFIHVHYLDMQK